ncbi:MAG: UDP-N-acetylmuramoyl-L-alanine--D-glutamate ligase [Candidatus Eremiobacteraeota bacterium]|nr:UDP-N-acetylmuramoyl-L-alanine--D-glutamate ligase [Candidatus Eremiobacteraeota bacterium]
MIGAGRTGEACAEVLSTRGIEVYVTDEQPPAKLERALAAIRSSGGRFVAPDQLGAILSKIDRAILSPGVPVAGALAQKVASAVPLVGEIEVAYELCEAPIIAVTGTKGKSTTTALIAHVLRCAGKSARVGGNIGNPLIREAAAAKRNEWVVAEVSSFQLETIKTFKPHISVLLNVSDDHLDRYASLEEYTRAKYRIFEHQDARDIFIGNLDDRLVHAAHSQIQAQTFWFSVNGSNAQAVAFVDRNAVWYRPPDGRPRKVIERSDIALPGDHNLENVLAAVLAATSAGATLINLAESIPSFEPMDHRLQMIAEVAGVRYVDDSKATNPAAVMAALQSFDAPIVLIAGGKSKGADLTQLAATIRERVKSLIAIGESGAAIARASAQTPSVQAATLEDAVQRAREQAVSGDIVLLSPGFASFDMFTSAEERGERFDEVVREIERSALQETAGA